MFELISAALEAAGGYIGEKFKTKRINRFVASFAISGVFFVGYFIYALYTFIVQKEEFPLKETLLLLVFSLVLFLASYVLMGMWQKYTESKSGF